MYRKRTTTTKTLDLKRLVLRLIISISCPFRTAIKPHNKETKEIVFVDTEEVHFRSGNRDYEYLTGS